MLGCLAFVLQRMLNAWPVLGLKNLREWLYFKKKNPGRVNKVEMWTQRLGVFCFSWLGFSFISTWWHAGLASWDQDPILGRGDIWVTAPHVGGGPAAHLPGALAEIAIFGWTLLVSQLPSPSCGDGHSELESLKMDLLFHVDMDLVDQQKWSLKTGWLPWALSPQ